MKFLFLTPPMGNWKRWGERHIACNALYAHLAAFVRGSSKLPRLRCLIAARRG